MREWWRRNWRWTIFGLVLVLIGLRLIAPTLIRDFANKKLNSMPDYKGHVDSVTLHIWRGAYQMHDFKFYKKEGATSLPFFAADAIDFHVQWRELMRGKVVGDVWVIHPKINIVESKNKPKEEVPQGKPKKGWKDVAQSLFPLKINHIKIDDGEVHFRAPARNPPIDMYLQELYAEGDNLINTRAKGKELFGTVQATARAMNSGKLKLNAKVNPTADPVEFKLTGELVDLDLKEINPFLTAYGNFDVKKGKISLYSEVATAEDKIEGYVKPIMKDVQVSRWKEDTKEGLWHAIWEKIVGTAATVLKNQPENQQAARIPIDGSLDNPKTDVWSTIGSVLENAFFKALIPGVEHKVSLNDVRGKDVKKK